MDDVQIDTWNLKPRIELLAEIFVEIVEEFYGLFGGNTRMYLEDQENYTTIFRFRREFRNLYASLEHADTLWLEGGSWTDNLQRDITEALELFVVFEEEVYEFVFNDLRQHDDFFEPRGSPVIPIDRRHT